MFIFALLVCIPLIALDQITKYIALNNLKPIGSITIINNVLDFTFVENRGAAYGIMQGGRWFFVILTIFISIGLIFYYAKLPKEKPYNYLRFSLILIFSGAVGNFIDRFLNGYVVDFIHVRFIEFPVFNGADIYVVCGTILMSILLLFVIKDEGGEQTKIDEIKENVD